MFSELFLSKECKYSHSNTYLKDNNYLNYNVQLIEDLYIHQYFIDL